MARHSKSQHTKETETDCPYSYAHFRTPWALGTQTSLAPFIQWLLVKVWKESALVEQQSAELTSKEKMY